MTCLRTLAIALMVVLPAPSSWAQTSLPPGFQESIVLRGLHVPTVVAFASDGRVFVAEKAGIIKVFAHLGDDAPKVFADLRTDVNDYHDRGLLGLALDPAFPARPYVYVLYTRDAAPGGTAPRWGQPGTDGDPCPDETNGCVVTGRLARLEAAGDTWTGRLDVLVDGWTQQYNSHSMGALVFGPDGALYASGGEGASWQFVDYGQTGSPQNPAGDPPGGVGGTMTPPFAEGGALRAQDLRTDGDPVGLNGAVIRIDPDTGEGSPQNPLWYHPDPNARRIIAYGFRNPFRFTVRPGTSQVWVADVGWRLHEEINVLPEPSAVAPANFGWPCYEGAAPQPGYAAAGLAICEGLYAEDRAATPPHFQYDRGGFAIPNDAACGNANASLSGIAFYEGGSYPEEYRGVLFFADYTRQCIWAMHPGADGVPSATNVRTFASGAAFPVDLKMGPGGDLFYVDVFGGTVRRIEYPGNGRPRAALRISPAQGPAPLTVLLDGWDSTDPEGASLTYEWDIDGDGTFEAGESSRHHVFDRDGTYIVRLRVTDDAGQADTASGEVTVGEVGPTAVIEWPAADMSWRAGRTYEFSGYGIDPQDGTLGDSQLTWTLTMHHCSELGSCHEHPIQRYVGMSKGSFAAPEHEYPSYLTIELVVTDSQGNQHATVRRIDPQPVRTTLRTEPFGLAIAFGDELLRNGEVRTVIAGSRQTVSAPSPQTLGGVTYVFSSWSDGGTQTHLAALEADGPLVATFVPLAPELPGAWTASDVGDVGISGSTTDTNGTTVLRGAGADVWSVADQFHYAWRALQGDGAITVRVAALDGIHPWSKAGVMFRASLTPDAAHGFLLLSAANGAAFQSRPTTGAVTSHSGSTANPWLRLERAGELLTASTSPDGETWQVVARQVVDLPHDALVGLAVTSHDRTRIASAAFDSVSVVASVSPSQPSWNSVDVGATGLAGNAVEQGNAVTVTGAGADIWLTEDAFHFAYRPLVGDFDFSLRVTRMSATYPWAKFGIMLRESLRPDSAHASLLLTESEGLAWQRRPFTGSHTSHTYSGDAAESAWVRLARTGEIVTAYRSADGITWVQVAQEQAILPVTVLLGMAVSSHVEGAHATALFEHVSLRLHASPATVWESSDVGEVLPGTTATAGSGSLTMTAAGTDIWGASDAFRYTYRRLNGDGEIVARVVALDGPHAWSKLGIMIRESLRPESPYVFALVSRSRGIALQRRLASGLDAVGSSAVEGNAPTWLRLVRQGANVSGYYSDDGVSWIDIDSAWVSMGETVLIGVALTSHDGSTFATGTVDSICVSGEGVSACE
jgi:glucose/arabinose dehydrogenase/regulation of enolase protein 1 (concanavalin A-like superfamily)